MNPPKNIFLRLFYDLVWNTELAFSNFWWGIKEFKREKQGFYKMKKIPLKEVTKYGDIATHKRKPINSALLADLYAAIKRYNQIIDTINYE